MYVGCHKCGWTAHVGNAQDTNYCPRCGAAVSAALDTRVFDPDGSKDKKWKQLQDLQKQLK